MKTESPKSWRDVIKVHPAADLFPMMQPDELKALGEDIKKNGMTHKVVMWSPENSNDVFLLDGRNRLDALELLGIQIVDRRGRLGAHGILNLDLPDYADTSDPYTYVLSVNAHRRHMTPEQRREVIAKVLKAQPEKSNLQIAKLAKVDDKTVGAVRKRLEARSEIPKVSTVEDTKGRKQPTRKKRRTAADVVDAKRTEAQRIADEAEQRSRASAATATAAAVTLAPKQTDIERALPDANRLVAEIMARDAIAPGYALAVAQGIAAKLDGFPDLPDILRRAPFAASAN